MASNVRWIVAVALSLATASAGISADAAPAPTSKPAGAATTSTSGPAINANPHQLHCLADKPVQPRFKLPPDRVWPAKPGEADVCLWDGDRFAAMSITIDDNWTPDHPFWLDAGKKTGLKFTWFVITDNIKPNSFGGTWDDWRKIREAGHDVQSHTVSHLSGKVELEPEYRDSIDIIQKNLPGSKVLTLAYPGGSKTMVNDANVAARYYIGARAGYGTANKADQIYYMMTNSLGGIIDRSVTDAVLAGTSTIAWMNNKAVLRGWACVHYHGVMNYTAKTDEEKKAPYPKVLADLEYIKSRDADLWFGTFREVVLYGQERDTAKLSVTASSDKEIRLALTDDMDDTIFDYPLTIKVRLPDAWGGVSATQGGKSAEAKLVSHEGGKFALVKAVPDRGEVVLSAGETK
jgi:peptidoglycan/xylan/chitin deacetylase (PgdA/CDA1 family)